MHITRILTAVSLVLMSLAGAAAHAQPADRDEARVIVKFKSQSILLRHDMRATERSAEQAAGLGRRVGLALRGGRHISERSQVVMSTGISSAALAQRLRAQGDVEYAEPDVLNYLSVAPNDPLYPATGSSTGQWYLRAPSISARAAINAEGAWDITTGSSSVVVAVLDTGVRYEHPDLLAVGSGGNLLPGFDFVTNVTRANDGDGLDADASDPGDWVTAGEATSTCPRSDSSWHGSRTSGLVAALTNNGTGIASVGRTVQVLPVRVMAKCGGFSSDIQAGMRWAAGLAVPGAPANTHPAKVLNMSFGNNGACLQSYKDAIADVAATGAVMVVAAGNSDGATVSAPASCPGVIAVGGLHHNGTKVDFSNLGSAVALSAPGGDCDAAPCHYIDTTSNFGLTTPSGSAYEESAGTSFSAPLVAATAALAWSVAPSLTRADVLAVLRGGAREFPTTGARAGTPVCRNPGGSAQLECYCTTSTCGAGMLDTRASVLFASLGVNARITLVGTATPQAGRTLVIDGSASAALGTHHVVAYQWTLTDGGGIVTALSGTGDPSKVSVVPSAAGSFTVGLTVTDDQTPPVQSTTSRTISVAAAVSVPAPLPPAGNTSSGGGALGWPWLAGLLAGVLALQALRRWGDPTQQRL